MTYISSNEKFHAANSSRPLKWKKNLANHRPLRNYWHRSAKYIKGGREDTLKAEKNE